MSLSSFYSRDAVVLELLCFGIIWNYSLFMAYLIYNEMLVGKTSWKSVLTLPSGQVVDRHFLLEKSLFF